MKLFRGLVFGLSIVSMAFVGWVCCRINDFKALVAYSSVAHMAIVICGLMTFTFLGYLGSYVIIIAHGLSSSGLFCIVNIYYERSLRRRFFFNKGIIMVFPLMTLFIFILCAANIAAPPTVNLLSEIVLIIRMMKYDYFMLILFPVGSFLGAVFTLFIFSYSQHGKIYYFNLGLRFPSLREYHLLNIHVIPLNYFVLNSDLFVDMW